MEDIMTVQNYKELVLFSMDQLNVYIKNRNHDYLNNKELEYHKPIVFKENISLYEEEALYLRKTRDFIEKIDISLIKTPVEFRDVVLSEISKYYIENGVPQVCFVILSEKLNLALEYFNNLNRD